MRIDHEEIHEDLFLFRDAVNVYVLRHGDEAVAIDFGSGGWVEQLGALGVRTLRAVLVTHGHRDQVFGLASHEGACDDVRVPRGDAWMFEPGPLRDHWKSYQNGGCPKSYEAPILAASRARPVVAEANDFIWGRRRITAVPTPGHTRGALTYVTDWHGKLVAFCGDAAHEGGTIHEPYHLEWDHWTAEGALAAWYGLERLGAVGIDALCPSHGGPVMSGARETVRLTAGRVMAFVKAKGSVCPGERDRWHPLTPVDVPGAYVVLPGLILFGGNSYLLAGEGGEGLVIDPTEPTIGCLSDVMRRAGVERITVAIATHYHRDHSDGLDLVREQHGAEVWLHESVAAVLGDRDRLDVPWLPSRSIVADRVLPDGPFAWSTFPFGIRHFPGQTWWHCALDTTIDHRRVLFSGDNFQPPSRWNGTGGFCAYNGCRLGPDGSSGSARAALELMPDLVCNGHGCVYAFDPGHYERIVAWAEAAEKAVAGLCPSGDPGLDYDPRRFAFAPFRTTGRRDAHASLRLKGTRLPRQTTSLAVALYLPAGMERTDSGGAIEVSEEDGAWQIRASFSVAADVAPGRHVVGAEITLNGRSLGVRAVALVDVE